jgi:hypothetical protein
MPKRAHLLFRKLARSKSWLNRYIPLPLALGFVLVGALAGFAAEAPAKGISPEVKVVLDTIWVIFTGILVFFMNAGFCMLETGFCRRKNAVNLLTKNGLLGDRLWHYVWRWHALFWHQWFLFKWC